MNPERYMNRIPIWCTTVVAMNLFWIIPGYGQVSAVGLASYYHDSLEGNRTANGEIFTQNRFTAAHKTMPFDTWVLLTDPSGTSVVVRVNDRLPASSTRMIDLTTLAARQLEMLQQGLKRVHLQVISQKDAWKWFLDNGYFYLARGILHP